MEYVECVCVCVCVFVFCFEVYVQNYLLYLLVASFGDTVTREPLMEEHCQCCCICTRKTIALCQALLYND